MSTPLWTMGTVPPHVWNTIDASNPAAAQDGGMDEIGVCALHSRSTPPHFVVNVMQIIVLIVLTHALTGYVTRVEEVEFSALVLCCVLEMERVGDGFGGLL